MKNDRLLIGFVLLALICGLCVGATQKNSASLMKDQTIPGQASETISIDPGLSTTDPKEVPRQIFVGTGGNIYGWLAGDDVTTAPRAYKNVTSGATLSYAFKRFTGKSDPLYPTTASDITAVR